MNWKHYEAMQKGSANISGSGANFTGPYQIGQVTTGRQRAFHRYYISIALPGGTEIIGEDQHNLRAALVDLARKLRAEGFELHVAGMDPHFYETGLSHNSGLGYIDNVGRVHMMDQITALDRSGELDIASS